jgi:heptosyltransferase-1
MSFADPMSNVLFIKTSSLGDVIHHMPALTEAKRHRPDARFAWVVEELFAPLVALHPAVAEVIPVASRRWRRALCRPNTWSEIALSVRCIRAREYERVIDTQGLFRSAVIARFARGQLHGYDARSIREPPAAWIYDVRHGVARDLHAIARNRALTALALGYAQDGAIDFGLERAKLVGPLHQPYAVLLHATARREKEWPQDDWLAVGRVLAARGLGLLLPWGTEGERLRSERMAAQLVNARVPERLPLDDVARMIAGASIVVGVDTGLLHLAAALAVPLVAIFVGSQPGLTGPMGSGAMAVVGGKSAPPPPAEVIAAAERTMAGTP